MNDVPEMGAREAVRSFLTAWAVSADGDNGVRAPETFRQMLDLPPTTEIVTVQDAEAAFEEWRDIAITLLTACS